MDREATIMAKLDHLRSKRKPICLWTDVDGTFVDEQDSSSDHRELISYLGQRHMPIIAVTGRDLPAMREYPEVLAACAGLLASGGTELFLHQASGEYKRDSDFERFVQHQHAFDRRSVQYMVDGLVAQVNRTHPHLHLTYQPRDHPDNVRRYDGVCSGSGTPPQPFKISLHFTGTRTDNTWLQALFQQHMAAPVVTSTHQRLTAEHAIYNLDIVAVTKREAVDHLIMKWGCRGVVAGNSGNDRDLLLYSGDAGIIPGDADPDLLAALELYQVIRKSEVFRVIKTDDGPRLLYIDPPEFHGPESLLRAAHALGLLAATSLRSA